MKKIDFPDGEPRCAAASRGARDACRSRRLSARRPVARRSTTGSTDGGDNQRTGWNKQREDAHEGQRQEPEAALEARDREPGAGAALAHAGARRRSAEHAGGHASRWASSPASPTTSTRSTSRPERSSGRSTGTTRRRQAAGGGGRRWQRRRIPRSLGFLQPGGSSDTPVIGPPDAQGRRPIYFVTGDGMLHMLNAATGERSPAVVHVPHGQGLEPESRRATCSGWPTPTRATRSRRSGSTIRSTRS